MKIHFIGICGIAMGAIAIELKRLGHDISGSDKGFYPPMSTALETAQINIMVGFKEEHIDMQNLPDMFVVGNAISIDNVELLKAQITGREILNYPEVLSRFVIREESIVVSGTYGKSTISSMLIKVFKDLGEKISYMTGAQAIEQSNSVAIEDSEFSIVEGDEYPAEKGGRSKFFYYSPKYLVVTSCQWDHTDIFKTPEDYIKNFQNIVKQIPEDGVLFLNKSGENLEKLAEVAKCKVVWIDSAQVIDKLNLQVIGKHNKTNATIALEVTKYLLPEFEEDQIIDILNNFKGVKRRAEIKFENDNSIIIDDFAHNPSKFKSTIDAIADHFENKCEIFCVVEPNIGNRTKIILDEYKETFSNPSIFKIIIPRWRISTLKDDSELISEEVFAQKINEFNQNELCVVNFDDVEVLNELVEFLKKPVTSVKRVVLFMGPEPFRGMIENLASIMQ